MKLYIDTNVYLDYFLDREKSRSAFKIFSRAIECEFEVVVSDWILNELNNTFELTDLKMLFELLKPKIIHIVTDEHDKNEAKNIPTHYADALHIVLAKKSRAEAIITNNVKDFESIFKACRPEDL
jgi:predicted nucleic acid-binding protein